MSPIPPSDSPSPPTANSPVPCETPEPSAELTAEDVLQGEEQESVYTSEEDLLDPILRSRRPNAKFTNTPVKTQIPKDRVFSFLSKDEVERMKQEEELEAEEEESTVGRSKTSEPGAKPSLIPLPMSPLTKPVVAAATGAPAIVRTAKAERRMRERLGQEGMADSGADNQQNLSPAEQRALKAEMRAAWRQARLKSLEQMVIKRMSEMIETNPAALSPTEELASVSQQSDNATDNCNNTTRDAENNVSVQDGSQMQQLRPSSDDFPRLALREARSSHPRVLSSRERVLDETTLETTTRALWDPLTGHSTLRTLELVQKTIETEVETCREKIISLELSKPVKRELSSPGRPTESPPPPPTPKSPPDEPPPAAPRSRIPRPQNVSVSSSQADSDEVEEEEEEEEEGASTPAETPTSPAPTGTGNRKKRSKNKKSKRGKH
ncbi:hypothetical protein B566_EDAN016923 [Ephemera danica]|nr:hypothetical protein B566_EDAN016923 [Ephemera danica]